jgi:hypothetical protein
LRNPSSFSPITRVEPSRLRYHADFEPPKNSVYARWLEPCAHGVILLRKMVIYTLIKGSMH